jgi:hypothetical protein
MKFDIMGMLEYKTLYDTRRGSASDMGLESNNAIVVCIGEECYYTDKCMLVVGQEVVDKFINNNLYEFIYSKALTIRDGKKIFNNQSNICEMSDIIKTFCEHIQTADKLTISGIEYLDITKYFALRDTNGSEHLFNADKLIFMLKGLGDLYDDAVITYKNGNQILVFRRCGRDISYLAGAKCDEKEFLRTIQKIDITEKVLKEE